MGAMFLAHAGLKIFVFSPAGTAGFFGSIGLPGWLAYLVILWELAGAAALILGLWSRLASLAMIPLLLGTIYSVHGSAGYYFNNANGGWEFPAFWIIGLVALALIGDGPMHCVRRRGPAPQAVSAISAYGTVWHDCVAEGLRLILTPHGVEDDEETRNCEGACRAGCEGHPARNAQAAFV
jgi:putative oxidoreductase